MRPPTTARLSATERHALIRDPESTRVERKARLGPDTTRKVRQSICAFANDLPDHRAPGIIVIGLDDDGSPTNTPITDKLLNQLNNFANDGAILPKPTAFIDTVEFDGTSLAVIEVLPHPAPPVRLNGEVFVRTGPAVMRATPAQEQRLIERRRSRDLPFDARPVYVAGLDDMDLDRFRRDYLPRAVSPEVLAANHRSELHQLMAHRLVAPDAPDHPTGLGVLLLADEPTFYIPGAYVDFIRINGPTLADPIRDQRRFTGPLSSLIEMVEAKLALHTEQAVDLSGPRERRIFDYPLVALRELVRNALMHRDYEHSNAPVRIRWFADRIEIDNPGGPYGQVTAENFGSGVTDYRNPYLAEALRNLGYVQRFGVGLELARRALHDNGNPALELLPEPGRVLVRVRSQRGA
jgi:ATP-dependent DNA helicase RecG